jgi:hypothetical protein
MAEQELKIVAKYRPYSQQNFNDIAFFGLAAVVFHTTTETCDSKEKTATILSVFYYEPLFFDDGRGNMSVVQAIDNPTHWQMFLIANNALLITGEKEEIIYKGFNVDNEYVDFYKDGKYRQLINLWFESDYGSCIDEVNNNPLPENEMLDPNSPFYNPYYFNLD